MELLKKTVELRADSEEESKNIIESYRKDAEEKGHRLPEWQDFCKELLELPYFKEIVSAYLDKGEE